MNKPPFLYFYLAAVIVFSSCTPFRPETNPLLDKKALTLAKKAKAINQNIVSSKGTGWARLETKEKVDKFRIAWAAVFPNKIRITFLLSGHPVETILSTGEIVTLLSHTGKHKKYAFRSKDPNMEKYINVPVHLSEMIMVLLGRLPLKNFDDAYFSPLDSSLSTIILTQDWQANAQSIHFDGNGKFRSLKSVDSSGSLLYEISVADWAVYDIGEIPVKIQIQDPAYRKLTLDITDFKPNPPIKASVFRLTESGS